MAASYFSQIQENIAEQIKNLLYNKIIPYFQKLNSGEHILRIAGEDLDKLNQVIISQKARESLFSYLITNGKLPTKDFLDIKKALIEEKVKQDKERLVKIPSGFYKNLKYKIDIVITGESLDMRTQSANLLSALQAITADPTLLSDPAKKKFFYKYLERTGISPEDIRPTEQGGIETLTRGGGGVSRPTIPATPVRGSVEATI